MAKKLFRGSFNLIKIDLVYIVLISFTTKSILCSKGLNEKGNQDFHERQNVYDASQGIPMDNIEQFSTATVKESPNVKNNQVNMVDTNGYILYCPCMGRFGNQADQLIGSLAFAKGLNRTLVLPPWIIYPPSSPFGSERIEFSRWFNVESLKKYHKVIIMEEFMTQLAPLIWPKGRRFGYCFVFRDGKKCAMKDGNPFGPFWSHFDVDFDGYFDHPGILWNSYEKRVADKWRQRFPPSQHLVLAFQGAPGDFPSKEENQDIQKYIQFSKHIDDISDKYIKNNMKDEPFVAIHLRNGADMLSVCDEIPKQNMRAIFSSEQCTGYRNEKKLTYEMCNPSKAKIIKTVKKYLKETEAKRLFIGTDNDAMIKAFQKALKKMQISFHTRQADSNKDSPIIDIAIMSKASYFIGNCLSSFSAFIRRQRIVAGKPVTFFGLD